MATKTARKTGAKSGAKAPVASFSFDSAALVKKLLSAVPERSRDVLIRRFGLAGSVRRETLESIGERSGITRERVRQIEAAGLDALRSSKKFKEEQEAFAEIARFVESLGAVVAEDELLAALGKDEKARNRFRFLLVAGAAFIRERETDDFLARWHIDPKTAKAIHEALNALYKGLEDDEVVPEGEMLDRFLEELKGVNDAYKREEVLTRWLGLSKKIAKNPLGEWGKASAPGVRTKGIRDYAYLAIKKKGAPMHFSEVAATISGVFAKKAHVATTHNELIKDPRFVLVGRGLYALTEWGYTPGVVRDVIREVLEEHGPLKKDEIITRVKKARFVKDNTIVVNLNDSRYFKRLTDGRYAAA
ncbi:MAG: hypothetical protein KGI78_01045 [Patescibacteria group bacterium]|nr:hypothetical protein [Patescibacteria group bacterium]MDE1943893.1 hypothetical protein [Patescibacteria group bacterium]MDE1945185.1 hypothetical protein [Patescibacteria group bacterium]MDE2057422.1 hypothetical protein [Patescibacteria group bacterium]